MGDEPQLPSVSNQPLPTLALSVDSSRYTTPPGNTGAQSLREALVWDEHNSRVPRLSPRQEDAMQLLAEGPRSRDVADVVAGKLMQSSAEELREGLRTAVGQQVA
jgi:hypothetical protein